MNNLQKRCRVYRLLVTTLFCLLLLLENHSSGKAAPFDSEVISTTEVMALPPEALVLSSDLIASAHSAPTHPKLDTILASLVAEVKISPTRATELLEMHALRHSDNRIHVQIASQATGLDNVVQAVLASGGEVTKIGKNQTLIQGWLPVGTLETVAAHPDVYFIQRPTEAVLLEGKATTEGAAVMSVSAWHAAGWRGQGVKVGIIDGGFRGYASLLGVDLPKTVTVKNFVDSEIDAQVDGTTQHGTANAEIIYDLAPNAQLFLAKIQTVLDLEQAIAWLKDQQKVDVISTSVGWYNQTPGDGTGFLADWVAQARASGILWATAAGNNRQSHWGGAYADPDGDNVHNFNGQQEVNFFGPGNGQLYVIPPGLTIAVCARWNDWTAVKQDYNLHLLRWNGVLQRWEIFASSVKPQNGGAGQTPTECAGRVTAGSATAYGFGIERINSNQSVNFEVFGIPAELSFDKARPARSLANLADAPDAITVAAVGLNPLYAQESYSSEGPINGPGGAESGGSIKPDLAAYTNVSTISYGAAKFGGTSAATPHVAGAAALVLSGYPSYSPDQLESFLTERALDLGPPGKDTLFGYGRLHLGEPPRACTYTIKPASATFAVKGGTGNVQVTAGVDCAWTAVSNTDWVTITAGSRGSGNGTVNYAVAVNTSPISRTGALTIAGQIFTVNQEGAVGGVGVAPEAFAITQPPDTRLTQTLTISNVGTGVLNWSIIEASGTAANACNAPEDLTWLHVAPISGTVTNGPPPGLPDKLTATADAQVVQGNPTTYISLSYTNAKDSDAVTVTFDSTAMNPGIYTGTLCIKNQATATPAVAVPMKLTVEEARADLAVTQQDTQTPVVAGSTTAYTVTVTNNGPGSAENVVLTDNLPAGVAFHASVPTAGNCTHTNGIVTCNLGKMRSGDSVRVGIHVAVNPATVGLVTNAASVTASTGDPQPNNNTASVNTLIVARPITLSAGFRQVYPAGVITVPITVSIPTGLLKAADIRVRYDPSVLRVQSCTVKTGRGFDSGACNPHEDQDTVNPDSVRFQVAANAGVTGEHVMAEIVFRAAAQPEKATNLDLDILSITDSGGNALPVTPIRGKVEVGPNLYMPVIRR